MDSKLKLRRMDEIEENEHKVKSNGVDNCVYLVATKAKIKVFLILLPVSDKAGQINSHMKMYSSDEVSRSWCLRHKAEVHKAANAYMVKSSSYIIKCSA